jgi:hypothetical protein
MRIQRFPLLCPAQACPLDLIRFLSGQNEFTIGAKIAAVTRGICLDGEHALMHQCLSIYVRRPRTRSRTPFISASDL